MNAQLLAPNDRPPLEVIHDLVAEYGAWRTFRAVTRAILIRDRSIVRRMEYEIDNHTRRDIGLEPEVRAPKYWELRL